MAQGGGHQMLVKVRPGRGGGEGGDQRLQRLGRDRRRLRHGVERGGAGKIGQPGGGEARVVVQPAQPRRPGQPRPEGGHRRRHRDAGGEGDQGMEGVKPRGVGSVVGKEATPLGEAGRLLRAHRPGQRRQRGVEAGHGAPAITRLAGKLRVTVVPVPTVLARLTAPSCRRISE